MRLRSHRGPWFKSLSIRSCAEARKGAKGLAWMVVFWDGWRIWVRVDGAVCYRRHRRQGVWGV